MHALCLLAVEAPDAPGALDGAAEFLDPYTDQVFDYFALGGRWGDLHPDSPAVCVSGDPGLFYDLLTRAVAAQRRELGNVRDARVMLGGTGVNLPDALSRVLAHPFDTEASSSFDTMMLGYWTQRLAEVLMGRFNFHSHFYDTVELCLGTTRLEARIESNPHHQWLVLVDLHN